MYDDVEIDAGTLLEGLQALLEQAKSIEDLPDGLPPNMKLLFQGISKGTEATVYTLFFKNFHHHARRDELLEFVGLDRNLYMQTAVEVDNFFAARRSKH